MAELNTIIKDINFESMDWAVFDYFEKDFPLIIDGRKVPVAFATPERWAQVQRDFYLKDENGQLILPAIAIRRGSPEINRNRFVPKRDETDVLIRTRVDNPIKKNSIVQAIPPSDNLFLKDTTSSYEYYSVPWPRFINMSYTVIIWASYFVDINEIQQRYLWEGIDHIFRHEKFVFTGTISGINETGNNEDNTKQERIQRVEYSITLEGYISDSKSVKKINPVNQLQVTFLIEGEEIPQVKYPFSAPPIPVPPRK